MDEKECGGGLGVTFLWPLSHAGDNPVTRHTQTHWAVGCAPRESRGAGVLGTILPPQTALPGLLTSPEPDVPT